MRGGEGRCDCSCWFCIGYAGGVWVDRDLVVYGSSFPNGHTRVFVLCCQSRDEDAIMLMVLQDFGAESI